MKKHHRERLIRLADKLQGKGPYEAVGPVPAKRFDLEVFQDSDFTLTDCDTAACACGWAATDPWFKRKQFPRWWGLGIPRFFGLETGEGDFLFWPGRYRAKRPQPTTVAKRIRQFVETHNV